MAYRFTNTEKWQDSWFSELKHIQMILFLYLCDNCDIAGFIEVNIKRWAADLSSSKEVIEGALKGLQRGLLYSENCETIYIRNFLKHQKNLPLNENNKAHIGILRRFDLYTHKFNIQSITLFIEGASEGLQSPTGIGIGNGIGNGIGTKPRIKIEIQLPTYDEFKAYAFEQSKSIDESALSLKYKAWVENDWKDGNGKKIVNWKSKLLNTIPYIQAKTNSLGHLVQAAKKDSDY